MKLFLIIKYLGSRKNLVYSFSDSFSLLILIALQFYFRYNLFTGCPQAKTCTIILRGGAEQFIEETERSLHDAIMIVRRTMKNDAVVAGNSIFCAFFV